jgi:hypothetical protein
VGNRIGTRRPTTIEARSLPLLVDLQAAINRFIAEHNRQPNPSYGKPTPTNVGINPLVLDGTVFVLIRYFHTVSTEVYFSWDIPRRAPKGAHIENKGEGHV